MHTNVSSESCTRYRLQALRSVSTSPPCSLAHGLLHQFQLGNSLSTPHCMLGTLPCWLSISNSHNRKVAGGKGRRRQVCARTPV